MRRLPSFAYCWLSLCFLAYVTVIVDAQNQNLVIPTTWLDTTSNLTLSEREDLASGAATQLKQSIDPGTGRVDNFAEASIGSLFSALSLQDFITGNTSNENSVIPNLEAVIDNNDYYGTPPYNGDAVFYGLAAFYAYHAYKQNQLLLISQNAYKTVLPSYITPSIAASGTGANRTTTFQSSCNASTIAGGLFESPVDQKSTIITAFGVGRFMVLSAYLYEATTQDQYLTTAQESLDFLLAHFWNGSVVLDNIDAKTCQGVTLESGTPGTDESGWLVEGLSIYANITKNETLTALLNSIVPSVVNNSRWTTLTGVISESNSDQSYTALRKGIFIRGLTEAYRRFPSSDLARYIETFITVQYNSILKNARTPGTDFYSTSWFGPPNNTYDPLGNIAALDVLSSAILFSPQNTTTSVDPGKKTPASGSKSRLNTGAIVGIAVGGVGVVLIIAVIVFLLRRPRGHKWAREIPVLDGTTTENVSGVVGYGGVVPFREQTPGVSVSDIQPRSKVQRADMPNDDHPLTQSTPQPVSDPSTSQNGDLESSGLPPAYSRS